MALAGSRQITRDAQRFLNVQYDRAQDTWVVAAFFSIRPKINSGIIWQEARNIFKSHAIVLDEAKMCGRPPNLTTSYQKLFWIEQERSATTSWKRKYVSMTTNLNVWQMSF